MVALSSQGVANGSRIASNEGLSWDCLIRFDESGEVVSLSPMVSCFVSQDLEKMRRLRVSGVIHSLKIVKDAHHDALPNPLAINELNLRTPKPRSQTRLTFSSNLKRKSHLAGPFDYGQHSIVWCTGL